MYGQGRVVVTISVCGLTGKDILVIFDLFDDLVRQMICWVVIPTSYCVWSIQD